LVTTYTPELWHDFFVMVGGAAAALTGLVFVALSINLTTIANDATHRYRAIGTLNGYMSAFALCAIGLMQGQNDQALGLGWIAVAVYALIVYDYGIVKAQDQGRSRAGLISYRIFIGNALYVAQVAGATMLALGSDFGIYVASIALIASIAYTTTGAWLLLMGVHRPSK
jgi:hypothetical protein